MRPDPQRAEAAARPRLGTYSEWNWQAKVAILEDRSDDDREWYLLRVLAVLKDSAPYPAPKVDEAFVFLKRRGVAYSGSGRLEMD